MARKKKDRNVEGLFFLNPFLVIKSKRFTKKDVNHIKGNISMNFNVFKIILASIVYVVSFSLMFYMRAETGNKQIVIEINSLLYMDIWLLFNRCSNCLNDRMCRFNYFVCGIVYS